IRRKDELGLLADSIDILSEKLVDAEEFRENLERNRRDFFSNVSHELRTPITVVKGYAETLADGYVEDPAKQQEYYERIRKECAGMERLVADLLILSKMENPDFELNLEVLNVIAVMQDVVRSMRMMCAERNIKTDLQYDDECSLIEGDYDRIRQLFLILMQNAVKYADEDTEITIRIHRGEAKLTVSVEDTGIAIPKVEWENVFEKFYRASNHGNKDGSGLGLMVAKHIVARHQGKIWVTSDEVKRTCFYIEFPECSEANIEDLS
ncbi:MAG: sensor histidine kinase, partial [Eubacterium sp.]